MREIQRNILLNPGPATTTDTVKYALVVPDICPREKEFSLLLSKIRKDLVKIVHGDGTYTSVLFSGSGTAAMDAVVNSVVPEKEKIAIIENGAYGERFVAIAKTYKIPFIRIRSSGITGLNLEEIENALKNDPSVSCVALVHHETTTGIVNPLKQVGEIVKRHNCTFIVDAISSFAGIPIDIKESQVDFLLSTSNKCIQGMAGLAFIICKKDSLEKIKDFKKRSYYLDLYSQYISFEDTGQARFTPPVQVVYALRQAIQEYFAEGEAQRYRRYSENCGILRRGLKKLGFSLLLDEELESHILLTVVEPHHKNYNFDQMHDFMYQKGFTIYPGKINQKTFRLAIMGDLYPEDINAFLEALKQYLDSKEILLNSSPDN